jgi:hypothetical protein
MVVVQMLYDENWGIEAFAKLEYLVSYQSVSFSVDL